MEIADYQQVRRVRHDCGETASGELPDAVSLAARGRADELSLIPTLE